MTAATRSVRFLAPPPGMEPQVDFLLTPVAGADGLYCLTADGGSTAAAGRAGSLRLFLIDTAVYLPDYSPRLPGGELANLGLARNRAAILAVVNPGTQTTVNLAAPIVLNPETGDCLQVILEGQDWPLRAPLTQAAA